MSSICSCSKAGSEIVQLGRPQSDFRLARSRLGGTNPARLAHWRHVPGTTRARLVAHPISADLKHKPHERCISASRFEAHPFLLKRREEKETIFDHDISEETRVFALRDKRVDCLVADQCVQG